MQLDECLTIIGNGDEAAGRDLIKRLAFYLAVARFKHIGYARSYEDSMNAVAGEVEELAESVAMDCQNNDKLSPHTVDEAFDVLVTTIRLINGEFV